MNAKLFLFLALSWLSPLLKATLTISADSKVSPQAGTVQLKIRVDQLQESQLTLSADKIPSHLRIEFPRSSVSAIRTVAGATAETDKDNSFYWTSQTEPQKTAVDVFFAVDFNILIQENTAFTGRKSLADIIETSASGVKYVTVNAYFYGFTGAEYKLAGKVENFPVQVLLAKPNAIPDDIKVSGVHKGVVVQWTGNKAVTYSQDGISTTPSKVQVMLFRPGEGGIHLEATRCFGPSSSPETNRGNCLTTANTTCTYAYDANTQACITCDDGGGGEDKYTYVDADQSEQAGKSLEVRLGSNLEDNSKVAFTGLEPDKTYYVALQFEEGVQRSKCYPITTVATLSLTEANGEDEGEAGDPRCFIVTASFGSAFAKHVDIFRWFRDAYILQGWPGKVLMDAYYEHSQPVAAYVSERPLLQFALRAIFWPLAFFLYAAREIGFLNLFALLFGTVLAASIALKYRRRYR